MSQPSAAGAPPAAAVAVATTHPGVDVSVVIPHVDRWDTLRATVDRVLSALSGQGWSVQVVVVCDASPEESWSRVVELARESPEVEAVRLDRRCWGLNARAVGMLLSIGDVVAMVDDDLDVDPESLVPLVRAVHSGASIASGVRSAGAARPTSRRAGSALLGLLSATLPGRPHDVACGTKAMSSEHARKVVSAWPRVRDMRFGMRLYQVAESLVEVPVERRVAEAPSNHRTSMLVVGMFDAAFMLVGPSRWGRRVAVPLAVAAAIVRAASGLLAPARTPSGRVRWWSYRLMELCAGLVLLDLALGARSAVPGSVEWTDGERRRTVRREDLGSFAAGGRGSAQDS